MDSCNSRTGGTPLRFQQTLIIDMNG